MSRIFKVNMPTFTETITSDRAEVTEYTSLKGDKDFQKFMYFTFIFLRRFYIWKQMSEGVL